MTSRDASVKPSGRRRHHPDGLRPRDAPDVGNEPFHSRAWPPISREKERSFAILTIDTTPESLGAAIRARRKSLGLTQEDVALQTGISRPTVRAIEAGRANARIGLALQMYRDLGLALSLQAMGRMS